MNNWAARLSPRERQVLALILEGKSEKEIGGALGISTNTVHHYIKRLYLKFAVCSRSELMGWFIPRETIESIRPPP